MLFMDIGVLVPGIMATLAPSRKIAKISLYEFTYSLYSSEAKTNENESVSAVGTKSNSSTAASCVVVLPSALRSGSPAVLNIVDVPGDVFGPAADVAKPDESIMPLSNPMTPVPPVNVPFALTAPV